jgi:hypothetical protein
MESFLSESDLDRLRTFANTPRYRRSPDQLVPSDEATVDGETPTAD